MEAYVHKTLMDVATPDMTFEKLYDYMNELIVKKRFMFTFEPHINIPDSKYGYKREDIYSFDNDRLIKL